MDLIPMDLIPYLIPMAGIFMSLVAGIMFGIAWTKNGTPSDRRWLITNAWAIVITVVFVTVVGVNSAVRLANLPDDPECQRELTELYMESAADRGRLVMYDVAKYSDSAHVIKGLCSHFTKRENKLDERCTRPLPDAPPLPGDVDEFAAYAKQLEFWPPEMVGVYRTRCQFEGGACYEWLSETRSQDELSVSYDWLRK